MEETLPCLSEYHNRSGSKYNKNAVPLVNFKRHNSHKSCKNCIDCRNYINDIHRKNPNIKETASSRKEKHKKSIKLNTNVVYCTGRSHLSRSSYPADQVPIKLFKKFPDVTNSPLLMSCLDCREFGRTRELNRREDMTLISHENNMIFCNSCGLQCEKSIFGLNLTGEISKTCDPCKIKEKKKNEILSDYLRTLKYNKMCEYESSCYICKSIFIHNPNNHNLSIELKTYLVDNIRMVEYEGHEYQSLDFLILNKDIIMYDILQFDHLTELEQRERGVLSENDVYIPKKSSILAAGGLLSMDLEVSKCQCVDSKCHLMETIRREKGKKDCERSPLEKSKLNYTYKLKEQGCVLCGYINNNLPRFFHFDHLDPTTKTECISEMAIRYRYSLEDVQKEVEKCRILCYFCHYMHTRDQQRNKLLPNLKQK